MELGSRERIAIMIEDKIYANFQPVQAYGHRERGNQRMQFSVQQSYEATQRAEIKFQAEERK